MANFNILICDDNEALVEGLSTYLSEEGMNVLTAFTGEDAIEAVRTNDIDVILLDIMLPGIDGYEVCKRVRKFSNVYIIMLSARSQELDRVYGLETGADDYVTKPFSSREIAIRINRAMDRMHPKDDEKKLTLAELTVLPETFRVFIKDEEVQLSSKEFALLNYLIANAGKVLTREHILNAVWSFNYYGDTRVIDGMVKRLRKKITRDDVHFTLQTVYGVGYRLTEE